MSPVEFFCSGASFSPTTNRISSQSRASAALGHRLTIIDTHCLYFFFFLLSRLFTFRDAVDFVYSRCIVVRLLSWRCLLSLAQRAMSFPPLFIVVPSLRGFGVVVSLNLFVSPLLAPQLRCSVVPQHRDQRLSFTDESICP